jgi:glucokinase
MNNQGNTTFVAGADIGGSHITVAIIDLDNKCLIENSSERNVVKSKGTAEEILKAWTDTFKKVINRKDIVISKLALAMPGPFDYENGISLIIGYDKYDAIYKLDVKQYLATELNLDPQDILYRNDAEAFLHGEVFCGAGLGLNNVMGLTLGTGFGSAISVDGVTTDLNLGSEKYKNSIADDYFTTRWFIKRFEELTAIKVNNVKDVVQKIEEGGIDYTIFEEYASNLSEFLVPYLKEKNVNTIILGGNITRAHQLFLNQLKGLLAAKNIDVNFKLALLNEEAALVGAAATFETILK